MRTPFQGGGESAFSNIGSKLVGFESNWHEERQVDEEGNDEMIGDMRTPGGSAPQGRGPEEEIDRMAFVEDDAPIRAILVPSCTVRSHRQEFRHYPHKMNKILPCAKMAQSERKYHFVTSFLFIKSR